MQQQAGRPTRVETQAAAFVVLFSAVAGAGRASVLLQGERVKLGDRRPSHYPELLTPPIGTVDPRTLASRIPPRASNDDPWMAMPNNGGRRSGARGGRGVPSAAAFAAEVGPRGGREGQPPA